MSATYFHPMENGQTQKRADKNPPSIDTN